MLSRSLGGTAALLAMVATSLTAQTTLVSTHAGSASTLLGRQARLDVRDVSIPEALARLEKASGVTLAFSPSLFQATTRVSCACVESTVAEALDTILDGTSFKYSELGQQILVEPNVRKVPLRVATNAPYVLPPQEFAQVVSNTPVQRQPEQPQQDRVVAGTVVDANTLKPLSGAQVVIDGTRLGALADAQGRFRITGIAAAVQSVTVSAIMLGYKSNKITARVGTLNLRIPLNESAVALDEIVVTGTPGGTRTRAIGNSVSKVSTAKATEQAPITNVQSVLAGRVAGVNVLSSSGNVGSGGVTRVRGTTSLSLSNEPLIFVDGVRVDNNPQSGPTGMRESRPSSRINDFNPEDIESIEVIKGPAAATLYGTEASHGVIQIITKKGISGQTHLDVSVKQGGNFFLDPQGRIPQNFRKDPATGKIMVWSAIAEEDSVGKKVFTTGPVRGYSANLSGGSEKVRYFLSGDYDYGQGYINYNWNRKFTGRANINAIVSNTMDVQASLGMVDGRTRYAQAAAPYGVWDGVVWGHAQRTANRGWYTAPPEEIAKIEAYSNVGRSTSSIQMNWRPWKALAQRLTIGQDQVNEVNTRLFPRQDNPVGHPFGSLALGDKTREHVLSTYRTFDYSLTHTMKPSGDLSLASSAGVQYYTKRIETQLATGKVFPATGVTTVSATASNITAGEDIIENKTAGSFVQEQLDWKSRIFLTAAVRVDNNSAFGTNFKLAKYPKLSATWVLNEESWWKWKFVNMMKLRGAWGQAGQQPDVFAAIRLYSPTSGPGDAPAFTPNNIGNPDLKPERGDEFEAGFDAGLYDDRVTLNFTVYRQTTKDAIIGRQPALSLGFPGTQFVNLGEIKNSGMELGVNAQILRGANLGWTLNLSLAENANKVLSLGGVPPIVTNYQQVREGYPIMGYWSTHIVSAKLDAAGKVTEALCEQTDGSTKSCFESAPRLFDGRQDPKWTAAIANNFTIKKNLSLYALVDVKAGYFRGDGDVGFDHMLQAATEAMVGYVDGRGPSPTVRAYFLQPGTWGNHLFIHNAGFARLREVSGTYTIPQAYTQRFFHASRASINIAARNLWFLWRAQKDVFDRPIIDPETRGKGTFADQTQTTLPPFSSIVTTLRINF